MDVLQVIHSVDTASSGPSYSVVRLSEMLLNNGVNLEVLTNGEARSLDDVGIEKNIISRNGNFLSVIRPSYYSAVKKYINATDLIIHGHGIWRPLNLIPLFKSRTSSSKIIWSPRGMFSGWSMKHRQIRKLPIWLILQKPAMNAVDCFHVTAESEYLDVRRLGFKQPISIIPNGVDIQESTSGHKRKQLLYLGRIHRQKGIELLIHSWKELAPKYADWCLKIAGPIRDNYSQELRENTYRDNIPRVEFLGEVLGSSKSKLLKNRHVLLLVVVEESSHYCIEFRQILTIDKIHIASI